MQFGATGSLLDWDGEGKEEGGRVFDFANVRGCSDTFAQRGTIRCAHSQVICTHLHMYEEGDNFQRLTSRPEIDTIDLSFGLPWSCDTRCSERYTVTFLHVFA